MGSVGNGIRKVNKPHPLPQSLRVLRYKLENRDHYHKDIPHPSISKILQTETKIQDSHHLDGSYLSVNSHGTPLAPTKSDGYWLQCTRGMRERGMRETHRLMLFLLICQTGYKINPSSKHWWFLLAQGDLSLKVLIQVQPWIQIQLWLLKILE